MPQNKFDPGMFQIFNIVAFIIWIPGMFVAGMVSGDPSSGGLIFTLWFLSTIATGPALLAGIFIRKAGAIGIQMVLLSLILYGFSQIWKSIE